MAGTVDSRLRHAHLNSSHTFAMFYAYVSGRGYAHVQTLRPLPDLLNITIEEACLHCMTTSYTVVLSPDIIPSFAVLRTKKTFGIGPGNKTKNLTVLCGDFQTFFPALCVGLLQAKLE